MSFLQLCWEIGSTSDTKTVIYISCYFAEFSSSCHEVASKSVLGSTEILMKMETTVIDKLVYLEKTIWKIGEIKFFVSVISQWYLFVLSPLIVLVLKPVIV